MALCILSPSVSSMSTDSLSGQGCGYRQSCSERTQVAIWSPSPQAPPICQAPVLLLGPLLPSGHPPPTIPVSSSSSTLSLPLSSKLRFLLPCEPPPIPPHSAPKCSFSSSFFTLLSAFLPRPLFPQSCSSFSLPPNEPQWDQPAPSPTQGWTQPGTPHPGCQGTVWHQMPESPEPASTSVMVWHLTSYTYC